MFTSGTDPVWMLQWPVPQALVGDERLMTAFRAAVVRQWHTKVGQEGRVPRETPRVTLVRPALEELTLLDEDGEPVLDEDGEPVTVPEPWVMVCEGKVR